MYMLFCLCIGYVTVLAFARYDVGRSITSTAERDGQAMQVYRAADKYQIFGLLETKETHGEIYKKWIKMEGKL